MGMSDTDILAHIREIRRDDQARAIPAAIPLEQFRVPRVVCFVLVVFCFVIDMSRSRKRKYSF